MPEKAVNSLSTHPWPFPSNPMVHWGFKVLIMSVFLGILVVWTIDGWNVSGFQKDFMTLKFNSPVNLAPTPKTQNLAQTLDNPSPNPSPLLPNSTFPENYHTLQPNSTLQENYHTQENQTQTLDNSSPNHSPLQPNSTFRENYHIQENQTKTLEAVSPKSEETVIDSFSSQTQNNFTYLSSNIDVNYTNHPIPITLDWVSAKLEPNYTSNLLAEWLAPGGEPCRESKTVEISIPKLDGKDQIDLSTGNIHEFVFQALDDLGKPHCLGGDYFETDLSGKSWKSRPPVKDIGNGTYSFSLQVHQDFPGNYNLTIILLFRHYEGLRFSPQRFVFDQTLRTIPITFTKSFAKLPKLKQCQKSDFTKDVWSGRWTRHAKNDSCSISNDGRFRCLNPNFPCRKPWCYGSLGLLESNGWTYSTHCSFKLFSKESAWKCLNNRWIFFWGDSNHCDTVRNILNFILDVEISTVPRLFDMNITNPRNPSQAVRITSIFNGHWNHTANYLGLNSLDNEEYREKLRGYFSNEVVPDTMVMNSGLHDGVYWPNLRRFVKGAEVAAEFWAGIMESVRHKGLPVPEVIFRSTVATGGYARKLAFNPNKMEAFNGVILDKMRQFGVVTKVVDHFDMTFPWHFDNRCNDGVHYGRAPAKMKWRDGEIGHQYFVDLMLGHVLLNVLCSR